MLACTVKFFQPGREFENVHGEMLGVWGRQLHRALGSPGGEAGVPELGAGR